MYKDRNVVCVTVSTGSSEKIAVYRFVCEDDEGVYFTPTIDQNGLDSLVIEKSKKEN